MITEIISIGDELLIGKTVDTNATYFSKKLEALGFNCLYKSTVGDNKDHIADAVRNALKRADLILVSGGLGPTKDDPTSESIAEALNKKLIFHPDIAEKIRKMFESLNMVMPESNLKQAYLPEGAEELLNNRGSAPGILLNLSKGEGFKGNKILMAFPGVPSELYYMWENHAEPYLKAFTDKKIYEKYLNFFGISESKLVEDISELMDKDDPKFRTYADNFQIQLRISSEHEDFNVAKETVEQGVAQVEKVLGQHIFGYDDETLEDAVAKLLFAQSKTIALAESCTGGLLSSRLTDVAGSSDYTLLNMVTYSNKAKINTLGVPAEIIESFGAVSSQTVESMAENIRLKAGTDIGVGVSGIAGPTGGTPEKPVGTLFIGISDKNITKSFKFNVNFKMSRKQLKWRFSQLALNVIRQHLK